MLRLCCLCGQNQKILCSQAKFLCHACIEKLEPSQQIFYSGSSLYRYNSSMRKLIHRAKIYGDLRVVRCLIHLFLNHDKIRFLERQKFQITPIPSSFWSRWRAKTDLAWLFAFYLAQKFSLRFQEAPFSLYWRIKKRSFQQERCRMLLNFLDRSAPISTLLIDDVVTSGYSLKRTERSLKDKNCFFLTLSEAYR